MKCTGAQIIIEVLLEQGVETVFGYPGGQVLDLYEALYQNSKRLRHVITAHEQGAAHAADGYARATGKTGVVIATSGPGATNLVTGIANAYLDSVPLVAITGNVSCSMLGRDSFQEVDIVGITMPVTKHNYEVKDINKLADTLREAFVIAQSGRPGPVLVDVPKDIQTAEIEFASKECALLPPDPEPAPALLLQATEMIEKSKRPYIYLGGGARSAGIGQEVMALASLMDAPIGCSLMGLSAIPSNFERFLGMQGMHGKLASSKANEEADLILALGVRFSDRAVDENNGTPDDTKIIHVDIDAAEINKNIPADLGIQGNVKDVVIYLLSHVCQQTHTAWQQRIRQLQKEQAEFESSVSGFTPKAIVETVNEYTDQDTLIATDVGQHQMWTAQYYSFLRERTFLTSGGLGAMGFGLGAAIGGAIGSGQKTILFTGDGSFGMNLTELATAVTFHLPIVVIIFHNGVLGMVRQMQHVYYDAHYSETTLHRSTDFVKLAKAFGADGCRADSVPTLRSALEKAMRASDVFVIDCAVDQNALVLPMLLSDGTVITGKDE